MSDQHEVFIYDKTAQRLADLFLPPDGTQISGEDLEACVHRLLEATAHMKRLEQQQERES